MEDFLRDYASALVKFEKTQDELMKKKLVTKVFAKGFKQRLGLPLCWGECVISWGLVDNEKAYRDLPMMSREAFHELLKEADKEEGFVGGDEVMSPLPYLRSYGGPKELTRETELRKEADYKLYKHYKERNKTEGRGLGYEALVLWATEEEKKKKILEEHAKKKETAEVEHGGEMEMGEEMSNGVEK